MKDEILDMLILGGFTYKDCAEAFSITVAEVREIYREYSNGF